MAVDGDARLQRCIRDLAALNALPSMCVGRTPEEVLDLVFDALPTVLDCELVYLVLPGSPPHERAAIARGPVPEAQLAELRAVVAHDGDGGDPMVVVGGRKFHCLEVEVPIGSERGRLVAGRGTPLDPQTDRVLIRTAGNVIGTTLHGAKVLENARRKDDFLAMLGHELRNPLAPIVTATELLARNASAAREQEVIERHTRHLSRLVDDLLDISRVTHGHVELRNEQVELDGVLSRAAELVAPLVARHKHVLKLPDASGLLVQGDPVRLTQVFGNLLTNAAKFTPPNGEIQVTVEPAPGRVRVTVRDNGRGIAADQIRRIFEPFVQADRERDALQGGLGLGLAIVKNLVERHHGTITARSEGRGRGAAFTVELPTVERVEQRIVTPELKPASARAGVRVLLVDDNVDIAELLSEALQDEGYETATAHDAKAAIARWRSFVPHAAVLDVGLPDLDGYQLAKTLRAEHGRGFTLIAATGYGQKQDRQRSADAGFDCHLVKPVSVNELIMVLDQKVTSRQ